MQAKSDKPILVRRVPWDYAYIVIDDLRAPTYQGNTDERTDLSVDVANLIAAMVKGKPEAAINPGLKRLRWMFLGNLPEILPQADIDGNGATLEQLDPKAVGWQDVFAMFDRMSLAYLPIADGNPIVLKAWSKAIVQTVDSATPPATTRMESIQAQANTSAAQLLAEVEN